MQENYYSIDAAHTHQHWTRAVIITLSKGLVIGAFDKYNNVLALEQHSWETYGFNDIETLLPHLWQQHDWLIKNQGTIILLDSDQRQLPVPQEAVAQAWLKEVYPVYPYEQVVQMQLNSKPLEIQYVLADSLKNLLQKNKQIQYLPLASLVIQQKKNDAGNLILCDGHYWFSAFKNGQLCIWHHEDYSNTEDIVYGVMRALQEQQLLPILDINVACAQPTCSLELSELKSYFAHLNWGNNEEQNVYGDWLPVVKLLQNAVLCAS